MTEILQITGEASLAASDVDRQPSRRRQQAEKLVAVELPVAVVPGHARPLNPSFGLGFPGRAEVHEIGPGAVYDHRRVPCWLGHRCNSRRRNAMTAIWRDGRDADLVPCPPHVGFPRVKRTRWAQPESFGA